MQAVHARARRGRRRERRGPGGLTERQKLALALNTSISPQLALRTPDADFTVGMLLAHGVPAANLRAANLDGACLMQHGCESAQQLRDLGYDCLDLASNGSFAASCKAAFGANAVVAAFLLTAGDAVCLAGSLAGQALEVSTEDLLRVCAGSALEAKAVLQQLRPVGACLGGVAPLTLLDTGLRKKAFLDVGYTRERIMDQTGASASQMIALGFE